MAWQETDGDEWMVLPSQHHSKDDEEESTYSHSVDGCSNDAALMPSQTCLFCKHVSKSLEANFEHLYCRHGFFIPNQERLADSVGLLSYCRDRISMENRCLYCHRRFKTARACQDHMKSTGHTKLRFEGCDDLDGVDPFYIRFDAGGYVAAEEELSVALSIADESWTALPNVHDDFSVQLGAPLDDGGTIIEHVGRKDSTMIPEDEFLVSGAERYESRSFVVDQSGSLLFPDGRAAGHRQLRQYYKQRLNPARFDAVWEYKTSEGKQNRREKGAGRKVRRDTARGVRPRNISRKRRDKKHNRPRNVQA